MAMTNAERQRAWRMRKREAEGRKPRRKGELAAEIARQSHCCARTIYRDSHYATAIDTIAADFPELARQIRKRHVRFLDEIVGHRVARQLAEILLREGPEDFAELVLPLIRDRWTGRSLSE
jgi:hypothetical protein